MNDALIERITQKVMERLLTPCVTLEASGRHVHLSHKAVEALFGKGYSLTKVSYLSQPGQFVCKERVTVKGPKKSLQNVVVLGPERPETQVEISATDALALGVQALVRLSGDIGGTPGACLTGPAGEIEIPDGVIVAKRHIHMTPEDAERAGVADKQNVGVRINGGRGLIFENVIVRISKDFCTFMHIDYDEANSCGFEKGMTGSILITNQSGGE